jgi:pyrroline-5-carboxylate reductase
MSYTLGLIGAGNMAEAIAATAISKSVLAPPAMIASDPVAARRQVMAQMGITVVEDNAEVMRQAEQVLLAVKPQVMAQAAADLATHGRPDQVVISIMAGISSAKLVEAAGRPLRIVRVMPNTPLMVGVGMAGIALGAHAEAGDDALAMRLFQAGGEAIAVDETLIDAITAISGSGPAYVFYLAEAMAQAASQLGLAEHADLLVRQTILGAATMLADSPDTPAELRRKVSSPGGTTVAAIEHMDTKGTTAIIVEALQAAHRRALELGSD